MSETGDSTQVERAREDRLWHTLDWRHGRNMNARLLAYSPITTAAARFKTTLLVAFIPCFSDKVCTPAMTTEFCINMSSFCPSPAAYHWMEKQFASCCNGHNVFGMMPASPGGRGGAFAQCPGPLSGSNGKELPNGQGWLQLPRPQQACPWKTLEKCR